jgi:hypothetical protein
MAGAFDPRRAALALAEAFREGAPIGGLPDGGAPASIEQGWQVAALMLDELGMPAAGLRSLADGTVGPLLDSRLVPSGAMVPAAALPCLSASAAFPLLRPLPPDRQPYAPALLRAAIGPARAAIDLAAWRIAPPPPTPAARIADLGGLGQVVLAPKPGSRGAIAEPDGLKVSLNGAPRREISVRARLVALADAARLAGGLPAGAALVIAELLPPIAAGPGGALALRIVGASRVEVRVV